MSPQAPRTPIIVRAEDARFGSARGNSAISTAAFFSNFAAGYLVGVSIASHPVGEGCGPHDHRGAIELFVVLEGYGHIEIDDVRHNLAVGDCTVVPVGSRHNLVGDSPDAPFRVLCGFVVAPGHEDDPEPWRGTNA